MTTLLDLLQTMQADMPRVKREQARRKLLPNHKKGLNRSHNGENDWMPAQWIVPTQGTYCGGVPRLAEEPASE